MERFDAQILVQMLCFFANKEADLTLNKMKAMKLIWLSDRLHLMRFGRTISHDTWIAMKNGPVPSAALDIANKKAWGPVRLVDLAYAEQYLRLQPESHSLQAIQPCDSDIFSASDLRCMEEVYAAFGKLGPFELSELSHLYPEWLEFAGELSQPQAPSKRFVIHLEKMLEVNEQVNPLFLEAAQDLDETIHGLTIAPTLSA